MYPYKCSEQWIGFIGFPVVLLSPPWQSIWYFYNDFQSELMPQVSSHVSFNHSRWTQENASCSSSSSRGTHSPSPSFKATSWDSGTTSQRYNAADRSKMSMAINSFHPSAGLQGIQSSTLVIQVVGTQWFKCLVALPGSVSRPQVEPLCCPTLEPELKLQQHLERRCRVWPTQLWHTHTHTHRFYTNKQKLFQLSHKETPLIPSKLNGCSCSRSVATPMVFFFSGWQRPHQ